MSNLHILTDLKRNLRQHQDILGINELRRSCISFGDKDPGLHDLKRMCVSIKTSMLTRNEKESAYALEMKDLLGLADQKRNTNGCLSCLREKGW